MKRQHLLYLSGSLALLIVAAFLYHHSPAPEAPLVSPLPETASFKAPAPAASSSTSSSIYESKTVADSKPAPAKTAYTATPPVDPEKYTTGPKEPWAKDVIGLVNRLDMADLAKAEHLLSRLTSLPPEGQILAMDHATKLIPDDHYMRMRPTLFGLATNDALRETVLLDALTRSEPVRMPTLVEMLSLPANAGQEEIREILVAYLDVDHGNDVKKWKVAVDEFLAANPDLL